MQTAARQPEGGLIELAATGDRAAFRQLTISLIQRQFDSVPPFEALVAAEAFARLAAAHGDSDDAMRLAGVLRQRAYHVAEIGDWPRADLLFEQSADLCDFDGLALSGGVEYLAGVLICHADAGDEGAAVLLGKLFDGLSATDADELRGKANQACSDLQEAVAAGVLPEPLTPAEPSMRGIS